MNYNIKFNIGDIVKMDLEKIRKNTFSSYSTPAWYSTKSYTIIDGPKELGSGGPMVIYVNEIIPNSLSNTIWIGFLSFDIIAMRRKKLERISNV